ncbi:TPA: lytic transglycosylase domain-containing protein, partial [Pseudomonas aeruginosa]|nr:lytic transglycosylase domain-containing protein [Pseudomonas aeruginosa]
MAAPAVAMPLRALVLTAGLYAVAALAQEVPPPAYQLAAQRAGIPSTVLYA